MAHTLTAIAAKVAAAAKMGAAALVVMAIGIAFMYDSMELWCVLFLAAVIFGLLYISSVLSNADKGEAKEPAQKFYAKHQSRRQSASPIRKPPPRGVTNSPGRTGQQPVNKNAQQQAPRVVPQQAPRVVPQQAPGVVPQQAPKIVPQQAPRVVAQQAPGVVPQQAPKIVPQQAPKIVPQQVTDAVAQPAPVKKMASTAKAPVNAPVNAPKESPVNAPKKAPVNAPKESPVNAPEAPVSAPKESPVNAPKAPSYAPAQQRVAPIPSPFVEQEAPAAAFDARVIFQNLTYDTAMEELRRAGCYLIRQCFRVPENKEYKVVFDFWIHVPTKTRIRVHDKNKTHYTYRIDKVRESPLEYLDSEFLHVNVKLLTRDENKAVEEPTIEGTIAPKSSCEEEGEEIATRLREFDCAKLPGTSYMYDLPCKYSPCKNKFNCMYLHNGLATAKLSDLKCSTDPKEFFHNELRYLGTKNMFD